MINRLLNLLFAAFQKRCTHNPIWTRADILEGSGVASDTQVSWCLRCGAYKIFDQGWAPSSWREPRADWIETEVARAKP